MKKQQKAQPKNKSGNAAKPIVGRSAIEQKLNIELKDDGLSFDQWLHVLKHVLIDQYGFRAKAAAGYVSDGSAWKDYYDEDYSPADAAAEDASYG